MLEMNGERSIASPASHRRLGAATDSEKLAKKKVGEHLGGTNSPLACVNVCATRVEGGVYNVKGDRGRTAAQVGRQVALKHSATLLFGHVRRYPVLEYPRVALYL